MSKTHEQKFTNALRDIFVGAKIEGESGYINLMRIKSRYYTEGVFPKLMEKIDEETAPFPGFREELFDKLYTFFKRYFSESGSIYFRHTPYYQDIYERIYTDERDVMLFWKTQNLYYVKTDRLFRSLTVELSTNHTKVTKKDSDLFRDDSCDSWTKFFFDASGLQNKRNNEKRNLVFSYEGAGAGEMLKFSVDYSKGATKTKTDDILKAIKKDGLKVTEDQLTRAFRLFERQSEVDFFINKNARGFLNEQFDLWMYQYLFKNDATDWNETRIKQMQALKRVAYAIIEFIAQFEDELVRIWNKPKFALRSNYVITFDRVFSKSEDTARKLLAHEGIAAQIEEWRGLGIIDEDFAVECIFEKDEESSTKNTKNTKKEFGLFSDVSYDSRTEKENLSTKNTKHTKENFSLFSVDSCDSGTEENLSTNQTKSTKDADNNLDLISVDSCDSWTEKEDLSTKDTKNTKEDAADFLSEKYRFLPFDTKHFKSLETEILSLFDNLDEELDGRLIHSENYQALNTLKDKFREKVKCIYIDPPYNTAASEILYQNSYLHSSWMTLIENRLEIAGDYISMDGNICVAIDDFELASVKSILNLKFGEENMLSTVVVRSNPHGRAMASGFSQNHEYALFYGRSDKSSVGRLPRDEKKQSRYPNKDEFGAFTWMNFRTTGANSRRVDRPKLFYPLFVSNEGKIRVPKLEWSDEEQAWKPISKIQKDETIIYPFDSNKAERVWNLGWERASKSVEADLLAKKVDDEWQIYRKYRPNEEGALPATWWDNAKYSATESGTRILKSMFGERENFSYPKSVFLVEDCLRASDSTSDSLNFDFFGGSGTTAHAVINLNAQDGGRRKYILVEANDYFHTVILPRVKKVVFSDKWKDGKAVEGGKGTSHFCKYFALEQYEDTLRRAAYVNDSETRQPAFFDNPFESPFASYVFLRDKKMSDALNVDTEADRITVDFAKLYPEIDWAETLSCVKGKFIKTVSQDSVTFEDGETVRFNEIDYRDILPLIWWDK